MVCSHAAGATRHKWINFTRSHLAVWWKILQNFSRPNIEGHVCFNWTNMPDWKEAAAIVCGLQKKENNRKRHSQHTGVPWQLFGFLYFEFPTMFLSFRFLIGQTSHSASYVLVCPWWKHHTWCNIGPRQSNMLNIPNFILDWSRCTFEQTRSNLNTFARYGLFSFTHLNTITKYLYSILDKYNITEYYKETNPYSKYRTPIKSQQFHSAFLLSCCMRGLRIVGSGSSWAKKKKKREKR